MFDIDRYIEKNRYLYHMATEGAWPQIQKHGLLTTNQLLDKCKVDSDTRNRLREIRFRRSYKIFGDDFGSATIRDQKVVRQERLKDLLHRDTTLDQWYELLNSRVFLWANKKSLEGLLSARSYRNHAQTVLTFSAKQVFEKYSEQLTLTDINTGAIMFPNAPQRGRTSFQAVDEFQPLGSRKLTEVTVSNGLPNVEQLLISVAHRLPDGTETILWSRDASFFPEARVIPPASLVQ
jgi:hypothetical protein